MVSEVVMVSRVATDLYGVSGRRMLQAVAEGQLDAGWMADYTGGTPRGKKKQLADHTRLYVTLLRTAI
jgi:hypothetical protein